MAKRRQSDVKEETKRESPAVSSRVPKPSLERKQSGQLSST